PHVHFHLAVALLSSGDLQNAVPPLREAAARAPERADLRNELGITLGRLGRMDEALSEFTIAAKLDPSYAPAHLNQGIALLGAARLEQGDLAQGLASLRRAIELRPDDPAIHSAYCLAVHFDPTYDPPAILREQLRWDQQHGRPLHRHIRPHPNDRDPHRRLR